MKRRRRKKRKRKKRKKKRKKRKRRKKRKWKKRKKRKKRRKKKITERILIIKPTRCTNSSSLFLECYADCLLASSQHNLYDIYHCCLYSAR